MIRNAALLSAVALLVGALGTPSGTMPANACRSADTLSANRLVILREVFSATDSLHIALRDSMDMAHVPADSVGLITSGPHCARAAEVLDSITTAQGGTPPVTRSFYLYSLGPNFAVEDVSGDLAFIAENGDRILQFFDSAWVSKEATLLPPWVVR